MSLGGGVAGEHAVLRVADSGPGLDPATAERAFTRGWSTKEARDGRPRGLLLDLVATGDVAAVDAAMEAFIAVYTEWLANATGG